VDVLLGNEEDVQQALGISGPEPGAGGGVEVKSFVGLMDRVRERYPNLAVMATTLRDVRSANRHIWSAVARVGDETFAAPSTELDVYDRVGGGDGFAAGFIYGLLAGEPPEQALRLGWAHGALVTGYPGDTTMATLAQVRAIAAGGAARIQR
jgi:2-dehydro-3-deoxygluconokinase